MPEIMLFRHFRKVSPKYQLPNLLTGNWYCFKNAGRIYFIHEKMVQQPVALKPPDTLPGLGLTHITGIWAGLAMIFCSLAPST